MPLRARAAGLLTVLFAAAVPVAADAASPGANGRIAFTSTRDGNEEIYAIEADGSGAVNLTDNAASDRDPAWSPDGALVAFSSDRVRGLPGREVYVVPAAGGPAVQVTSLGGTATEPAWSPDGSRLAVRHVPAGSADDDIVVVDLAGGHPPVNQTGDLPFVTVEHPAWPVRGPLFYLSGTLPGEASEVLEVVVRLKPSQFTNFGIPSNHPATDRRPDGDPLSPHTLLYDSDREGDPEIFRQVSTVTRLTTNTANDIDAVSSPDGTKIAFASDRGGLRPVFDVWVMDADGTDPVNLTNTTAPNLQPSWQPRCTIEGTLGDDRITGTPGNDLICALAGDDRVDGAGGDDAIFGGPGNDRLAGGAGDDTLAGQEHNDTLDGSAGNDQMSGGAGKDRVTYASRTSPVQVTISSAGSPGDSGGPETVFDTEKLVGGKGADRLTGSVLKDALVGGPGADVLRGEGGPDSLDGGVDADTLEGGQGADTATYAVRKAGEPVDARIDGTPVSGGALDGPAGARDDIELDVEKLLGGKGDDVLRGSSGPNTLTGGRGADQLLGLGGNDVLAAKDGFVDVLLNCDGGLPLGAGDRITRDAADPAPIACETDKVG